MKKIIYLFLTASLIFSSCSKEENATSSFVPSISTSTDIRDQLVGVYSGAVTGMVTSLVCGAEEIVGLVTWRCEKSDSSNINLILPGFGGNEEDLIIPCNQITEVAGGLTFSIIETDGIIMANPDGSFGPAYILNGENGPQTYTSADGEMSFSFTVENAQIMYELETLGTKN